MRKRKNRRKIRREIRGIKIAEVSKGEFSGDRRYRGAI